MILLRQEVLHADYSPNTSRSLSGNFAETLVRACAAKFLRIDSKIKKTNVETPMKSNVSRRFMASATFNKRRKYSKQAEHSFPSAQLSSQPYS